MNLASSLTAVALLACPLSAQTLNTDVSQIPLSIGGTQQLFLTAGAPFAGESYFVGGTLSGTSPGLPFGGVIVPLNQDPYTLLTLNNPNQPPLLNGFGTLDGSGWALAQFTLPAGSNPGLAGLTAHHAYITLNLTTLVVSGVSNAASCQLVAGPIPKSLLINEVDYDNITPGADTDEFIEIINVNPLTVSLVGVTVELVDETGSVYSTMNLSDAGTTLDPGEILVIHNGTVTVDPGAKVMFFPGLTDQIQDGPTDGLRLVAPGGFVLDSVGYEGTLAGVTEGTSDLIEDPAFAGSSMVRCPVGSDTDDNDADFLVMKTTSPGAPNTCQ